MRDGKNFRRWFTRRNDLRKLRAYIYVELWKDIFNDFIKWQDNVLLHGIIRRRNARASIGRDR